MKRFTHVTAALVFTSALTLADDWPQLFGPDHTGISKEKLNTNWPAEGFKPLWTVPLAGWGSFAVSGDRAFTLTNREINGELREVCIALDTATGKEIWVYDIEKTDYKYKHAENDLNGGAASGPASTPTVSDGRVYVYSNAAKLCCLDAQSGKELWSVDIQANHGGKGRQPRYGNASSPTVDGDLVFIAGGGPGESLLAFNKVTGEVVWKTEDMEQSYATHRAVTIHGERQIIYYLKNDLAGVSVKDGKVLWRTAVPFYSDNNAIPIVSEDKVYGGSSASRGGFLYEIIKDEDDGELMASQVYKSKGHDAPNFNPPVLLDGHLYGNIGPWQDNRLKCIEFDTGKVAWEEKLAKTREDKYSWSSVIVVDGKLLVLLDDGKLLLVDPTPEGYKELARFQALEGKCWSTAAFSNGRLFLRSNKEGVCYDLSAK